MDERWRPVLHSRRVKTSRDFAQTRPEQLQVLDRNRINVEGATIIRCWRVIGQYLQINARWSHFWMQLKGRNHQFMHHHAPSCTKADDRRPHNLDKLEHLQLPSHKMNSWSRPTIHKPLFEGRFNPWHDWIHEAGRQFTSHCSKVGSSLGMIKDVQ